MIDFREKNNLENEDTKNQKASDFFINCAYLQASITSTVSHHVATYKAISLSATTRQFIKQTQP